MKLKEKLEWMIVYLTVVATLGFLSFLLWGVIVGLCILLG